MSALLAIAVTTLGVGALVILFAGGLLVGGGGWRVAGGELENPPNNPQPSTHNQQNKDLPPPTDGGGKAERCGDIRHSQRRGRVFNPQMSGDFARPRPVWLRGVCVES